MNASITRRGLIQSAVTLASAAVSAVHAGDDSPSVPSTGSILAYVGTYTPNGQGIHIFSMNLLTGVLTPVSISPSSTNPSWLAFGPGKKFLYAVNEIANFNGGTTGSVSAFSVDATSGALTLLNTVSSGGAGPAHCSVDPSGKYVLAANYGGGNVAVLPILANGSLGNATDVKDDTSACSPACPVGPTKAQKAPPGSFAISGHDAPHAHMIQTDPAGNYVIVNDLGLDKTIVWKFDRTHGTLSDPKTVSSSPGAGPRHFVFHPNGRFFYSLNEEASTLAFMTYDAATGTLHPIEEISTLPAGFKGTDFTSEVVASHDGRFLYVCNRLHNSVAVFATDGTGGPRLLGEFWTRADYPRNCNIDPTGRFLYVCHNRSDNVTTFRIGEDGGLAFTGQYVAVGSPAVIVFR